MIHTRCPLVLVLVVAALACSREPMSQPGSSPGGAAQTTSATSTTETLDDMDPRAAVPLLPMMANHQKRNMRDHLVAVQEIVAALATDDFAGVGRAAARLGFSEQMGQMCTHMGAGAPGFTEQALGFHHTADGISAAAAERDAGRVLRELSATLQTCTSCHAA